MSEISISRPDLDDAPPQKKIDHEMQLPLIRLEHMIPPENRTLQSDIARGYALAPETRLRPPEPRLLFPQAIWIFHQMSRFTTSGEDEEREREKLNSVNAMDTENLYRYRERERETKRQSSAALLRIYRNAVSGSSSFSMAEGSDVLTHGCHEEA